MAVLLAALLGYVIVAFESIERLTEQLVESAVRIHSHHFRGYMAAGTSSFRTKDLSFDELADALQAIGLEREHKGLPGPDKLAERAEALLGIVLLIGHRYPFSSLQEPSKSLEDPEKISEWAEALDLAAGRVAVRNTGLWRETVGDSSPLGSELHHPRHRFRD